MRYYIILQNDDITPLVADMTGAHAHGIFNWPTLESGDLAPRPIGITIGADEFTVSRSNWEDLLRGLVLVVNSEPGAKNRITNKMPSSKKPAISVVSSTNIHDLNIQATRLVDLEFNPILFETIKTDTIVDRFWSEDGGMYRGTITMISGDPGTGKTSLLVSQLINMAKNGAKVGIVSAEMKPLDLERSIAKYYPQIREVDVLYPGPYLAGKVLDPNGNPIPFNVAFQGFLNRGYDVVLLDSMKEIGAIFKYELNIPEEKAHFMILDILDRNAAGYNVEKKYTSFLMIQQVNKNGEFVGGQRVVHMINGRMEIRHCKEQKGAKYLVFKKNRNGLVGVKLYFQFGAAGVVYDEARLEAELELMGMLASSVDFKDTNIGELLGKLSVAEMDAQEAEFNGYDEDEDDD